MIYESTVYTKTFSTEESVLKRKRQQTAEEKIIAKRNMTCLRFFQLFISCIIINYVKSEHSCSEGAPGQYCTDDLSGYHNCQPGSNGLIDTVVHCSTNTRCSCYVNIKCKTDIPSICNTYKTPFPMTGNFVLRFHGEKIIYQPNGKTSVLFQGEMRQNLEHKMFIKTVWDPLRRFQLIVPNGHGMFTKYIGHYPNYCVKTTLVKFPKLGDSLKRFTLISSENDNNSIHQEWYLQVGHRHIGEGMTKTIWNITYDKSKARCHPVSFQETHEGSANSRGLSSRSYWKTGLYFPGTEGIDWFRIPNSCIDL